jgi:galactokinase
VTLIGGHTDYNEGQVVVMGIERHVLVAFGPRRDGRLRACSLTYGDAFEAELATLAPRGGASWPAQIAAVACALRKACQPLRGMDMAIAGDVPIGAGLGSSAALQLAVARAASHASELEWDGVAMAALCRRAEDEFIGAPGGITPHFGAAAARGGRASLLDCRTLDAEDVPLPPAARVVVMETAVSRAAALTTLAERRAECQAAVRELRWLRRDLQALRDADASLVERAGPLLSDALRARALHAIGELERARRFADALRRCDLACAGRLMNESHESLRDVHEVSCAELNLVTDLARRHGACWGARASGTGLGGAAVALVEAACAADFAREIADAYRVRTNLELRAFVSQPAAGARLLA